MIPRPDWRKFASEGFRSPSKEWAYQILDNPNATDLQKRLAQEALAPRFQVVRERQPGEEG